MAAARVAVEATAPGARGVRVAPAGERVEVREERAPARERAQEQAEKEEGPPVRQDPLIQITTTTQ